MRELKFRAWSDKYGMHKVGCLVIEKGYCDFEPEDRSVIGVSMPHQSFLTIEQYTGLKDKNGKEIFEGDIITNGTSIVDVKSHPTLGFYTVVNGEERFFGSNTSIKDFENDVEEFSSVTEIIGNIYENPELLEVTEWE